MILIKLRSPLESEFCLKTSSISNVSRTIRKKIVSEKLGKHYLMLILFLKKHENYCNLQEELFQ